MRVRERERAQRDATAPLDIADAPRVLPSTHYGVIAMRMHPNAMSQERLQDEQKFVHVIENVLGAYLNRHTQLSTQVVADDPNGEWRSEQGAALQASVESRMPRAYQWLPQASLNGTMWMEFHPSMVYLCAPFAQCIVVEAGVYFAFERLMSMIGARRECSWHSPQNATTPSVRSRGVSQPFSRSSVRRSQSCTRTSRPRKSTSWHLQRAGSSTCSRVNCSSRTSCVCGVWTRRKFS